MVSLIQTTLSCSKLGNLDLEKMRIQTSNHMDSLVTEFRHLGGVVNKAEVDVFFWNSLAFSMIQQILAIRSLVPLPFLKPA